MMHSLGYQIASYLTEPVCKSRECYYSLYATDPDVDMITALAEKIVLVVGLLGWSALSVFSTLPGIALRGGLSWVQGDTYIHDQKDGPAKALPENRTFSMLSWNVCAVSGGYSITDGGVVPWDQRLDRIEKKIIEQDADVVCLYEIFDAKAGFNLSPALRNAGYKHVSFNFGARAVGASSGIMIASKYEIEDLTFTPFPVDSLVGRTKNCTKGVVGFDLVSNGQKFASVFATHLQHSEEPMFPTVEEVQARQMQMEIIADKVNQVAGRTVLVTGDLNLDDNEYQGSSWNAQFDKGDISECTSPSWGGDEFCAKLMDKPVSGPLNLDHTMAKVGSVTALETKFVETGYDPTVYSPSALSDHKGLFSRVTVL